MQTSAAILAGGAARRFSGTDKSALVVEGRTILERQLSALASVSDDVMIVGGQSQAPPEVRRLTDRLAGHGPLGGIQTALESSRHPVTLILACDMPFVTADLLHHLAALAAGADLVVPETEQGYHPLCAAYTRACLGPVTRRLADGTLKLTALFADVRVRIVGGEELERFGNRHRLMANVNSPDDYRRLEAVPKHQA